MINISSFFIKFDTDILKCFTDIIKEFSILGKKFVRDKKISIEKLMFNVKITISTTLNLLGTKSIRPLLSLENIQ